VYVVDGDPAVRNGMAALLRVLNVEVTTCCSAEDFLEKVDPSRNGCVISEVHLPGMSGTQLQRELVSRGLHLPLIMLASHGDVPLAVLAMRRGAIDFIEKPFVEDVLLRRVRQAIRRRNDAR
jgi:FixJ family two-component response regulator